MLYRVAIKTIKANFFYLSSDNDAPETDAKIDTDNIQFLSNLNPTYAHTFSSKEIAKEMCANLPYPYNEKIFFVETLSKESPFVNKIYYRICKEVFNKLNYITKDKKFTRQIILETASFSKLEYAEEFFNSLPKFTQKTSCIALVNDFGAPDYKFKNYFITKTGEKTEIFPL